MSHLSIPGKTTTLGVRNPPLVTPKLQLIKPLGSPSPDRPKCTTMADQPDSYQHNKAKYNPSYIRDKNTNALFIYPSTGGTLIIDGEPYTWLPEGVAPGATLHAANVGQTQTADNDTLSQINQQADSRIHILESPGDQTDFNGNVQERPLSQENDPLRGRGVARADSAAAQCNFSNPCAAPNAPLPVMPTANLPAPGDIWPSGLNHPTLHPASINLALPEGIHHGIHNRTYGNYHIGPLGSNARPSGMTVLNLPRAAPGVTRGPHTGAFGTRPVAESNTTRMNTRTTPISGQHATSANISSGYPGTLVDPSVSHRNPVPLSLSDAITGAIDSGYTGIFADRNIPLINSRSRNLQLSEIMAVVDRQAVHEATQMLDPGARFSTPTPINSTARDRAIRSKDFG